MRAKPLIGAVILIAAALIAWAGVAQDHWEDRCHRAGGTVESRFEGFMTIIINGVPHLQPQYSDHCWVDGREVNV